MVKIKAVKSGVSKITENKSLGSKLANIIRERIITGEYMQGMRLTEIEFADAFGVSHSCVRDAFHILNGEGLIKSIRNKHTEIVIFEKQDIEELYSLRLAIELLSAETCVKKGSIQINTLKDFASKISQVALKNPEALFRHVEADMAFHEVIIYSSNNSRVINVWNSIRNQLKMLLYSINKKFGEKMVKDILDHGDHDEIIKAFENSDIKTLCKKLTSHIEGGMEQFIKHCEILDVKISIK